jgi:hypothetical protein
MGKFCKLKAKGRHEYCVTTSKKASIRITRTIQAYTLKETSNVMPCVVLGLTLVPY